MYYVQAWAVIADFLVFAELFAAADLTQAASSIHPLRSAVQKPSFPPALLCTASHLQCTRNELHPGWGGSVFGGADGQMAPSNVQKNKVKEKKSNIRVAADIITRARTHKQHCPN